MRQKPWTGRQNAYNDLVETQGAPGVPWMDANRLNAYVVHKGQRHDVKLPDRFVGEGHDMQEAILFVMLARACGMKADDFDMAVARASISASYGEAENGYDEESEMVDLRDD